MRKSIGRIAAIGGIAVILAVGGCSGSHHAGGKGATDTGTSTLSVASASPTSTCPSTTVVKAAAPGMYQDPHYGSIIPVAHGSKGVIVSVELNCLPSGASVYAFDKNVDDTRFRQDNNGDNQDGPIGTTVSFSFTDKPIGEEGDVNELINIVLILDATPDCTTQLHLVTDDGYLPNLPAQCGDPLIWLTVRVVAYS